MQPVIVVTVDGFDYDRCVEYSLSCASTRKTGSMFNRGCKNSDDDPRRVERTGKLGEVAFGKLYGLSPDFAYRRYGDQYDFVLRNGQTIDVKTSMAESSRRMLIRCATRDGREVPIRCDVYVAAKIRSEDRIRGEALVELIGYVRRGDLDRMPRASGLGGHTNIVVSFGELRGLPRSKKIIDGGVSK